MNTIFRERLKYNLFFSAEIEPNTFISQEGTEKGLPHHLFTEEELRTCFAAFHVEDVHLNESNHYCLTGYKRELKPFDVK